MDLTPLLFDRIHRYLNQQMTEAERQAFEHDIQLDADLRKELEIQRQLKTGVQVLGYRQTLDAIRTELDQAGILWQPPATSRRPSTPEEPNLTDPAPSTSRMRWLTWVPYAVAASVLLVSVWLFYPKTDPLQQPIAANPDSIHTISPPSASVESPVSYASPVSPVEQRQQQLANQYDQLAARYFTPSLRLNLPKPIDDERLSAPGTLSVEELSLGQDTLDIRAGMQRLGTGEIREAIRLLKPTTDVVLVDWQANARWFLALAYLKNHQPSQARQQLRALTTSNPNPYTNDAENLLKALSR